MIKILHTSWGYDMTSNDYCKILEENGKTAKCQMIGGKYLNGGGYNGEEVPDETKTFGEPFRVRVKGNGYYKGSYPFCVSGNSKRMGFWSEWKGTPNYYNTMD